MLIFVHLLVEEDRLDGLDGTFGQLEVLMEYTSAHASYAVAIEGESYFRLFGVTADVQSLQGKYHFLAFCQITAHAVLVDINYNSCSLVLYDELLVDIATAVIASDTPFNLDVFLNLHVLVGSVKDVGVFLLQLPDGDDTVVGDAIVAV